MHGSTNISTRLKLSCSSRVVHGEESKGCEQPRPHLKGLSQVTGRPKKDTCVYVPMYRTWYMDLAIDKSHVLIFSVGLKVYALTDFHQPRPALP